MSNNHITINNSITEAGRTVTSRIPPNAPLDFGTLAILFNNMVPQSSAPSDPSEKDVYLDDGTNTVSGTLGFRQYDGSAWEDFGLQTGGGSSITSTPESGQYQVTDMRLASDFTLIVEYNDVPAA